MVGPNPAVLTLPPTPIAEAAELSTSDLKQMATEIAKEHSLNTDHFLKVISCESNWDTQIQSAYITKDGTRENSWGLVQINLSAHPNVTKEQALNPRFALTWMAEQWSLDGASMWSCWTILQARGWSLSTP